MKAIFIILTLLLIPVAAAECLYDENPDLEIACKKAIKKFAPLNKRCDYECSWKKSNAFGEIYVEYSENKSYFENKHPNYESEDMGYVRWFQYHEDAFYVDKQQVVGEENSVFFYLPNPEESTNDKYIAFSIYTTNHDQEKVRDLGLEILKELDGGKIIEVEEETEKVKNKKEQKIPEPINKIEGPKKIKPIKDINTEDIKKIQAKQVSKETKEEAKEIKKTLEKLPKTKNKTKAKKNLKTFSTGYINTTTKSNLKDSLKILGKAGKEFGGDVPVIGKAVEIYGEFTEKLTGAIPDEKILNGINQQEILYGQGKSYTPNAFIERYSKNGNLEYTSNGKKYSHNEITRWRAVSSNEKTYWIPLNEYGNEVGDVAMEEVNEDWKFWRNDNIKLINRSNIDQVFDGGKEYDL